MDDPLLFFLALLALLGAPGPTNTMLAVAGADRGVRGALLLLVAELAGYFLAIAAIRLAVAPLVATWPAIGAGLRLAAALYVLWIAVRLWQRAGDADGTVPAVTFGGVFITTLLNPKALIVALSILPSGEAAPLSHLVGFALTVIVTGLAWIVAGHAIGAVAAGRGAAPVRRGAAVALFGFAGLIAVSAAG